MPPERGIFLSRTWRMHPDLCRFVSEAVYDGQLKSEAGCASQRIVLTPDAHPALKQSGQRRAGPRCPARGLLNLGYFGVEFAVGLAIGSVSLFADSVDFLEDASVDLLIVVALGWTARNRARLGMALAGVLLIPGLATLWTAWEKFNVPLPPQPVALTLAGLGALAVNLSCAYMLVRYRSHSGSLTRAAFLSARNDALANIAIIAGGLMTAFLWRSAWPDLFVGLGIAVLNADAAREVWRAAREEHRSAFCGSASPADPQGRRSGRCPLTLLLRSIPSDDICRPIVDEPMHRLLAYDRRRYWLENGWSLRFRVALVEPASGRPPGIKYAFTLHDVDRTRLLGFDNAHGLPRVQAYDHRHRFRRTATLVAYEFRGADELICDFFEQVEQACRQDGVPFEFVAEDVEEGEGSDEADEPGEPA